MSALSENCICKYCILVAPGQLFADLRQWNDEKSNHIALQYCNLNQDLKIDKTSEQKYWL